MYTLYSRYMDTNGYILIYLPTHPRAINSGSFTGYVYEHIVVAEDIIGRPLNNGDVVHHLDLNRSNNSPDNLLVLSGPMHAKLHSWMDKNTITPTSEYQERIDIGCVRCKTCQRPINYNFIYCSQECHRTDLYGQNTKYIHPTKEVLEQLVWEYPTTYIANELNVSDKAIDKLCKKLGIQKPPRGYWTKQKAIDIDRYIMEVTDDGVYLKI